METWQIVLIVAAVAAVIWYLMKNRAHGRAAPIGNPLALTLRQGKSVAIPHLPLPPM
jgi:hypothetical protein